MWAAKHFTELRGYSMARATGTFNFPSNFEVAKAAPLDARLSVETKEDLVTLPFPYKGMIVSVTDDGSDTGTYVLTGDDGSQASSWEPLASTTVTSMAFSDQTLTLTMSDGTTLTAQIASSNAPIPAAPDGQSETPAEVGNQSGTLSFSSRSS